MKTSAKTAAKYNAPDIVVLSLLRQSGEPSTVWFVSSYVWAGDFTLAWFCVFIEASPSTLVMFQPQTSRIIWNEFSD
jgi:hypothetical protein